ncbi:hypothetical protein CCR75_006586 [Bremia lactucae]|uniref:Crinkler effector protein N-terminal domain-containing protein n=1 Tax=Bremia lactucae TaxID=4779 RepID=A0A976FQZ1_BRELC|nr:hypothetical protein CCR75_006586 [Bremia lactucae]
MLMSLTLALLTFISVCGYLNLNFRLKCAFEISFPFRNSPTQKRMVSLFCALVDVKGPAFSVQLDDNDTVDALKKKIKKENPAKDHGRGPWLTDSEVQDGVSDVSGFKKMPYPVQKLRAVGLASGQVVEASYEEAALEKGFCHVVVQLPVKAPRGSCFIPIALPL